MEPHFSLSDPTIAIRRYGMSVTADGYYVMSFSHSKKNKLTLFISIYPYIFVILHRALCRLTRVRTPVLTFVVKSLALAIIQSVPKLAGRKNISR